MLSLLAAFAASIGQSPPPAAPAAIGHTAWIFSTVGHSEWCPAGNVQLDLTTGEYSATSTASRRVCGDRNLERPVRRGKLAGSDLLSVRAAYVRALAEGLESEACREGRQTDTIILSNGGTPILLLTTGRRTAIAPDELTCWSDAANSLHSVLDHLFAPEHYGRPR